MSELSFACNNGGGTSGFSESKIDVARQLIKLRNDDNGNDHKMCRSLTRKRRKIENNNIVAASSIVEDEDLKLGKRKSRSIHYIYRSTKPMVFSFDTKRICCNDTIFFVIYIN
ncbi:hypothetical protein HRI_000104600 [Hibiscus trionum]|uniref:Uncharacterized protein n=1 Tax=Hibiscus trionum TaxID=183268 RepID=A0A9W7LGQ7_HIBTR|nr:hypothetical protein HRI_000104600 [Hibiscus trionum]